MLAPETPSSTTAQPSLLHGVDHRVVAGGTMVGGTERLAAYRNGHPRPSFGCIDILPRTGFVIAEEDISHPREVMYVNISQVTADGDVVGELHLNVPQLLALVADLQEARDRCYQPYQRCWQGNGPYLTFGEGSDQSEEAADGQPG